MMEHLTDYDTIISSSINVTDLKTIAKECDCSVATIRNYINGDAPNIHLEKALVESFKKILKEKSEKIQKKLKNEKSKITNR